MKREAFLLAFLSFSIASLSQTASYDLINFKLPVGWKFAQQKENVIQYQKLIGSEWGQINIYKNTKSKGSIQLDLKSEWNELVLKNYNIVESSQASMPEQLNNGWQKINKQGNWVFNGKQVTTKLTTHSGNGACFSIVCNATQVKFLDDFVSLINTVQIVGQPYKSYGDIDARLLSNNPPSNNGFKFNQTNFEDGWVSIIKENWVEVSKSNVRVLLHYPKEGTIYPAQPDVLIKSAWDILIAPRYQQLQDFKTAYIEDFKRPYFATGKVKESETGKQVFVTLFRRSNGWIEIITPSSLVFTQTFGFNPESIRWGTLNQYTGGWVVDNLAGTSVEAKAELFDLLDNMVQKNRFAVDARDLNNTGEWKDHYASNTFYVDYYTGAHAGINTYSSSQSYNFGSGNVYDWKLVATNSFGGRMDVAQGKSNGTFKSLSNWQIYFSNIDGKPKKMNVYFSAIKGGRILWMNDAEFPGSGIFTGFTQK